MSYVFFLQDYLTNYTPNQPHETSQVYLAPQNQKTRSEITSEKILPYMFSSAKITPVSSLSDEHVSLRYVAF